MTQHRPAIRRLIAICNTTLLFVAFAFADRGHAADQEGKWKVGVAATRITPTEPVRLAGYASRTEPSQGVALDLFAKALAIQDANGNKAVIVTTDLIGLRQSIVEPLCLRITQETGLAREQILFNSSHTHTGPALSLDGTDFDFPKEHSDATARYTQMLIKQLAELVATSLKQFEPARLTRGVGVAGFVMNRREFTDEGVILGFNPRGHADRSVPVLRIDGADGKLRAVLFGAACHNTTLTGRDFLISADFAGYAQREIERQRPGVQAMFMQGCAGDANPHPRGNEAISQKHGSDLATEVLRILDSELEPIRGTLQIAHEDVNLPLRSGLTSADIEQIRQGRGGWRSFMADKMIETLDQDGRLPTHYSTPIAVWQFGGDLTLVALSGEVVVDYVSLLENALGPRRLWIAAYCNDVYGYLPSARVLVEGGYETRGLYYGSVGLFTPETQTVLVEHVRRLAEKIR
jgi:hypothetical protein